MVVPLVGFFVIFLDACATLVIHLMYSFQILSLIVSLHIFLSILISFTSSRAYCPLVVAPYLLNNMQTISLMFSIGCKYNHLQNINIDVPVLMCYFLLLLSVGMYPTKFNIKKESSAHVCS